ncbi:glycoside hydrolase family 88 protein [Bacteroides sp. 224]|uniref:glycoside hydrolase family 88 protein n=1 Tax=Bacteroides sp. 224 TaxID=2302936 RepID=UPI0013D81030|nr:glycoside hydrolase family 88 protein [Bacteroides sp. 224]NDV66127.1 glucuronyl hydrolase [Bacteroides sp. 224]
MRKTFKSILLFAGLLTCTCACQSNKQEPLSDVINRSLDVATQQSILMAKALEDQEGRLPTTTNKDGKLKTSNYSWWCSGFFPGELWYLYENNPTAELKKYAEMYTSRVEPAKNVTNNHDVGFMLYCSFGNGFRLTKNPHYLDVMTTGAKSLATRYRPEIGLIRSWDFNKDKWQYPVIIDNMMNLEFLSFIAKETGDSFYSDMINSHAKKTMEHHFRPDYSSYHVISYDTITGLPHAKNTHQGYADESAWARGQAWAVYGYTMMARETGDNAYLEHAKKVAEFIMNHPNMPEDKVPYWDFNAPDIPNTVRDASSAAIIASALIELSQLDKTAQSKQYLNYAIDQIRSLASPVYLAEPGTNNNFVLMHSTGHLPGNSEVDVPLSYADYYFVEALLRLKKLI